VCAGKAATQAIKSATLELIKVVSTVRALLFHKNGIQNGIHKQSDLAVGTTDVAPIEFYMMQNSLYIPFHRGRCI
jgi:hypothetical protein